MTPVIEIESIYKRYLIESNGAPYKTLRESILSIGKSNAVKEFWALSDISLTVMPGETLGIIGENGAGKTTLLKILSKITSPTSGKGKVQGRVASLLEVGTGFHSELTGRENIYLNGVILGLTKKEIDRKFEEIVEFAGVNEFLNTPLKHYSSGMWARLAFSVAAHLDPDILLIDEVLSVGDAEFQKKSMARMNDLSQHGRTIIFVSHNMAAVRQLCSRCIVMSEGRIRNIGDVNEAIDYYLSGFSQKEGGVADLSSGIRRSGSQKVMLKRIELRNQNDDATGRFFIKDDLVIHLFLEASEAIRKVKIVVEILESTNEPICCMFDSDSGFSLRPVDGNVHVSLVLKDIRFYPGRYFVKVSLISEIYNFRYDSFDEIDCAIGFDVENRLIMDRTLTRSSGLLLLTPEWKEY